MTLKPPVALLAAAATGIFAQSPRRPAFDAFEVATIKPTSPDSRARFIRMESVNKFYAQGFSLQQLVAAAYSLTPRAISGGPPWTDSDLYDILASTPGSIQPNTDEQMAMLRKLLTDRFQLAFHRESKELPVFAITVAKGGPKLKPSAAPPGTLPELINVIRPEEKGGVHVELPARNATMAQFAAMMQRSVVYDFDLEWTPDENQFSGNMPRSPEPTKPSLFAAMQEQLGLRLEATRGRVQTIVIDRVQRPSEN